ncbi:MAG: Holliday junction branch migration protein RuvA [Peptostreptococcaceae bacterium]|nr:Holliday junction branch migration protein RuvA [Peptostreptococcaceae bacterium]
MFGYITGTVTEIYLDHVILETGGIGFRLTTSQFTNRNLEMGKTARLYTKLNVREDDISLLGFWDKREMKMFELLTSVSKVGPKAGFSILSTYDVENLQAIILRGDVNMLAKASGVGKKTAERIIVELRDKVDRKSDLPTVNISNILDSSYDEALEVLLSLGFNKSEASVAIEDALAVNNKAQTNELVKVALSKLSKL